MIPLDEYKTKVAETGEIISQIRDALDPDAISNELKMLEEQMGAADFWNDIENANKINQRAKSLQIKLDKFRKLNAEYEDLAVLIEMAEEAEDDSLVDEIRTETEKISQKAEAMQLAQMLKGPYDNSNAVLSLHAGAGGTEELRRLLHHQKTEGIPDRGTGTPDGGV